MRARKTLTPLGRALDRARRARNLTVTAVSTAAESNRASWYRATQGRQCRDDTIARFAAALGMTVRRAFALADSVDSDQPGGHCPELSSPAGDAVEEIRDRIDLCLEELACRAGASAVSRPMAQVPTDTLRRSVEAQLHELCRRSLRRHDRTQDRH